jgi:signal transduction histidine kinase
MLRRKLLLTLGSLVLVLVAATLVALWLLVGIQGEMKHVETHAASLVRDVGELNQSITAIEIELYELELGRERRLDPLIEGIETLRTVVGRLEKHYAVQRPETGANYGRIQAALPEFERHVSTLATTRDRELAQYHTRQALELAMELRHQSLELGEIARTHAQEESAAMLRHFRWLMIGLLLLFLIVIDVAVMAFWRMATMILHPVDRLIEASRQLADEHFDHRVALGGKDEFDELAKAHNHLASRLQAQEARKVEVLSQVARTLNHELNNACAIIELQLTMLQGNFEGTARSENCLRQIRENLNRMTRTVQALKNVHQIVLTDYTNGEKMLDLERSVQPKGPPAPGAPEPKAEE